MKTPSVWFAVSVSCCKKKRYSGSVLNQRITSMHSALVPVLFILLSTIGKGEICESPQYLELYTKGTVNCAFQEDFFGVLWYNTSEYSENRPILDYQNMVKSGDGYESGEFDVHRNGSLIINNVLPYHDVFTVAYIRTKQEVPNFNYIRVIGVANPDIGYPVFSLCNTRRTCFSKISSPSAQCSVRGVRPPVTLILSSRTTHGDKNISNELSIIAEGYGYTSRVNTTDVFHYSHLLVLLVCKVSSFPGMLQNTESLALVLNDDLESSQGNATSIYVELNGRLYLSCPDKNMGFVVWKKIYANGSSEEEVLLYSVFIGETFSEIFAEDFTINKEGYLLIQSIQIKHEGTFECVYGDGLSAGSRVFDVTLFVLPVPAFPLITGCNHQQYCVLEANPEGNLTCTVRGIRPYVQLEWKVFNENDEETITFTNQKQTVINNGETFDITLTLVYSIRYETQEKLLLECKVPGSVGAFLPVTSKVYLIFAKGNQVHSSRNVSNLWWAISVIAILVCLLSALSGILIKIYFRNKRNVAKTDPDETEMRNIVSINAEASSLSRPGANVGRGYLETTRDNVTEMTSMFEAILPIVEESHSPSISALNVRKKLFIKQLQEHYKDLYEAIQPVPYDKDTVYTVDSVFVEGGITFLDSKTQGARKRRVTLDSYKNIFDDPRMKSKRRIFESDPGCGKSTLTLKLSYDWCTSASVLKDIEILILLRLSQLGGITSIYSAIKETILPRDSTLNESEITDIINECNSLLIIMDEFDKFLDNQNDNSDINKIIAKQMFREVEVIITTRTLHLPKKYPPGTTRIRLTGFNDDARRCYIRKAVTMNDEDDARNVEEYPQQYPLLHDLCQTTSRFVLFAHTKYETDHGEYLNFASSYSSENIVDYLNGLDFSDKLASLCILGLTERTENIKEPIRQLCDEGIIISGYDELLLQRLYVQLLEIAATIKIPVKIVQLHNCLQSVELATPSIKTTSGLALTSRIPVKELRVLLNNRDMSEDEANDILQFASMCPSLHQLAFYGSVPPQPFKVDSTLATLKSRNVTVKWLMFKDHPVYILNLDTGRWQREDNNEEPTSANFKEMRSEFAKHLPSQLDETFQKGEIKRIREELRKDAEERRKNNPA